MVKYLYYLNIVVNVVETLFKYSCKCGWFTKHCLNIVVNVVEILFKYCFFDCCNIVAHFYLTYKYPIPTLLKADKFPTSENQNTTYKLH